MLIHQFGVATKTKKSLRTSRISSIALKAIAWGNIMASPALANPWSDSFHQSYAGILSHTIGGLVLPSNEIFSLYVSVCHRSLTLVSIGAFSFLNKGWAFTLLEVYNIRAAIDITIEFMFLNQK